MKDDKEFDDVRTDIGLRAGTIASISNVFLVTFVSWWLNSPSEIAIGAENDAVVDRRLCKMASEFDFEPD